MSRLGRKFGEFDAHAVRVRDVRQDGLRGADARLTDICSPLLEHRSGRTHVLDVQTKMIDPRWPLRVRGLQFHECVLADLDINQRWLSFLVGAPECLGKSHGLRVVRYCLVKVRDTERDMIEPNDSAVRVLRRGSSLNCQSNQNSRNEQKKTSHKQLLSAF